MRTQLPLALAGLLLLSAGCQTHRSERWDRYRYSYVPSSSRAPAPVTPPKLALNDAQVERALARHADRQSKLVELSAQRGQAISALAPEVAVERLVPQLETLYRAGARDLADQVISNHPDVYRFDGGAPLSVEATFRRRGGRGYLELRARRLPGVQGTLAVAFPPGTYGVATKGPSEEPWLVPHREPAPAPDLPPWLTADFPEREGGRWVRPEQEKRYGQWPPAQDLALLRAPVLTLPAGRDEVVLEGPVACASVEVKAPEAGRRYRLRSLPLDSAPDKLLLQVCGQQVICEESTQLALWLGREDVSWARYVALDGHRGRLVTFGSGRPILRHHANQAATLLLEAGVDPRPLSFFRSELPEGAAEATPAPAPESTPADEATTTL